MEITELLKAGSVDKLKAAFTAEKPTFGITSEESLKQFSILSHDVLDESVRRKKTIKKDTGRKNEAGEAVLQTTLQDVCRVAMPLQRIIVERRVGFMLSIPVRIEATYLKAETDKDKGLVTAIDRILDDNKTYYKDKEIARRLMSELEVAEIWYFVENENPTPEEGKLIAKLGIFSPEQGDSLFPMFDSAGKMTSFARGYKLKENGKEIEHFDVYTEEAEWKYVNRGKWGLDDQLETPNPVPNAIKKIPVVYYCQKYPEWHDVQKLIQRLEDVTSNHGDMNDYYGAPMLKVSGEVQGFSGKGEQGKVIQLASGADANYLALASEPQSIKMEQDNLIKFIYSMSQTPDITFENLKGIGNLTGVALELLFLDAHMAVKNKEEIVGIGFQRRLNILKSMIGGVIDTSFSSVVNNVKLKPTITPYLPKNYSELLDNLNIAVTGGLMSKETAVEQNPLVQNVELEMERLKGEEDEKMKQMEVAYQNTVGNINE